MLLNLNDDEFCVVIYQTTDNVTVSRRVDIEGLGPVCYHAHDKGLLDAAFNPTTGDCIYEFTPLTFYASYVPPKTYNDDNAMNGIDRIALKDTGVVPNTIGHMMAALAINPIEAGHFFTELCDYLQRIETRRLQAIAIKNKPPAPATEE